MTEARIGRLLVASLHQAIAEVLPSRLEFYENWLSSDGLRQGTIGLAPLMAVFSFLRLEGEVYGLVVQRAGEHAASWVAQEIGVWKRFSVRILPARLRLRSALQLAADATRRCYPPARTIVSLPPEGGVLEVRASLFCEVRETVPQPLCGFYFGLVTRLLEEYGVAGRTEILTCRAVDPESKGCRIQVALGGAGAIDELGSDR